MIFDLDVDVVDVDLVLVDGDRDVDRVVVDLVDVDLVDVDLVDIGLDLDKIAKSVLDFVVLKNAAQRTSQYVKWTSGARVFT